MQDLFPFKAYFADAPGTLFAGVDYEADVEKARGCWRHLRTMFQELEECRAFELLKVHDSSIHAISKPCSSSSVDRLGHDMKLPSSALVASCC